MSSAPSETAVIPGGYARFQPFETLLDRETALSTLRAAVVGADDGELFLERRHSESLVLDDGRIRSAGYDAAEADPKTLETERVEWPVFDYRRALAAFERPLIEHALARTGGNQLRAAELLGINRNTLRKRISELELEPGPLGRLK